MATIKAVIVPAKALKDNKHKVRISVAHNGDVRYILTDIIIDSEKQFKNGQIARRPDAAILNTKLRGIMQSIQKSIDSLEYVEGLTCAELIFQIKTGTKQKNRTLESVFLEYIAYSRAKESTKREYSYMFSAITNVISKNMLIEKITRATLLNMEKVMRDRKNSSTTIHNRLCMLKSLIIYAVDCGYMPANLNPFLKFKLPKTEIRQAWLTADEIKAIRDAELKNKCLAGCRDMFMLSYYLGGINAVDLMSICFKGKTAISYVRKKTEGRSSCGGEVSFAIPEEAQKIIGKYKNKDGYIVLPSDKDTGRFGRWAALNFFRYYMPMLAQEMGLKKLIYYSARKSFAQHALSLGISESTINYILGHSLGSSKGVLYHYVYVTPEMATEAVRKVLDNLK